MLLLGALAVADPADALPLAARSDWKAALAAEQEGRLDQAEALLARVLEADPYFDHATMALARVYERQGDDQLAEDAYRRLGSDADAVEALTRLLIRSDRPDEALQAAIELQQLSIEAPGTAVALQARALAETEPTQAAALVRDAVGYQGFAIADDDAQAALRAIVVALHEQGDGEAERELLDWWLQRQPSASDWVTQRLERFTVEDEARRMMAAAAVPLDPTQQRRLQRARALVAAGDLGAARQELQGLVHDAPRSPEVHAALGDVQLALGDVTGAERSMLLAAGLDPLESRYEAALADLLATRYAGRFDDEAAARYRRALRLAPSWTALHLELARVLLRQGRPAEAEAALSRFLADAKNTEGRGEARALLADLVRARPAQPTLPDAYDRPVDVDDEAWLAYHVAHAYVSGGKTELAIAELQKVQELAPRFVPALNLHAKLLLADGRLDEALDVYRRSIALDRRQPAVLLILANHTIDRVEQEALIREAAQLGYPGAHFLLAELAWGRLQPLAAREHLDTYFQAATSGIYHARALDLDQRMRTATRTATAVSALGLGGMLVLPVAVIWRRRSGVGVRELLDRAPSAYRDIARIGSAIRHEVLKHNTTTLPAIAAALDDGDPAPATWAADKLFGERGAVDRFRGYVRELERLGAVHGMRLNLRHVDPVFCELVEGMDRLQARQRDMRAGAGRGLADDLRRISEQLNDRGYAELGRLLATVCILPVDEALVRAVWRQVVAESEFRTDYEPELDVAIEVARPAVRVFRDELEDILANVLRNSLQATLECGELRVGVRIDVEEDEVTFLERLCIRVRDDAPRRISTAVIRGRYIDRGLGLTVDLISKNGGSIHVEDEPGWSKAVVVRLPLAAIPDHMRTE